MAACGSAVIKSLGVQMMSGRLFTIKIDRFYDAPDGKVFQEGGSILVGGIIRHWFTYGKDKDCVYDWSGNGE